MLNNYPLKQTNSFKNFYSEIEARSKRQERKIHEYKLFGDDYVIEIFKKVFPEFFDCKNIGKKDFSFSKLQNRSLKIRFANEKDFKDFSNLESKVICAGGHVSGIVANLNAIENLQNNQKEKKEEIVWLVDDFGPIPLFFKSIKRHLFRTSLEEIKEPNFIKLEVDFFNLLRHHPINNLRVCLTNIYFCYRDLLFERLKMYNKTIWFTCFNFPVNHAVIDTLQKYHQEPLTIGLKQNKLKFCYVGFEENSEKSEQECTRRYYNYRLFKVNDKELTREEIKNQIGDNEITSALQDYDDYYINTRLCPMLGEIAQEIGVNFGFKKRITEIILNKTSENKVEVIGIKGFDLVENKEFIFKSNKVFLSLGPFCPIRYEPIEPNSLSSIASHFIETIIRKKNETQTLKYSRTFKGFLRHLTNYFLSKIDKDNPKKPAFLATGGSLNFYFACKSNDKEIVESIEKFWNTCLDTMNSHWSPLGFKRVVAPDPDSPEKQIEYNFYAWRGTAGGVSPNLETIPQFVYNLLHNSLRVIGKNIMNEIESGRIIFEFIDMKNCSRETSGINCFNISILTKGLVLSHALSGMGMVAGFNLGGLGKIILDEHEDKVYEELFKGNGYQSDVLNTKLFEKIPLKEICSNNQRKFEKRLGILEKIF